MSITPFGRPGGASGADDHRDIVGGSPPPASTAARPRRPATRSKRRRTIDVGTRGRPPWQPRQLAARICSTSGANARLVDQAGAIEQVQQIPVLGRLVPGVDRAPHRTGPGDAEDAGEGDRVVGRQDRRPCPRPRPPTGARPRATVTTSPAPRHRSACARPWSGRPIAPSEAPLSQVVDQAHRPPPSAVDCDDRVEDQPEAARHSEQLAVAENLAARRQTSPPWRLLQQRKCTPSLFCSVPGHAVRPTEPTCTNHEYGHIPMPPSMGSPAPVMNLAASEHKNTTTSVMSPISPRRPAGVSAMTSATAASGTATDRVGHVDGQLHAHLGGHESGVDAVHPDPVAELAGLDRRRRG